MSEYTTVINGIPIKFPYEKPYDIQIEYMEKVLDCLENKKHAILESPTGTGKTLSLLCATLGWISKQKEIKTAWTSKLLEDSDDDDNQMEGEGKAGGNKKDAPIDTNGSATNVTNGDLNGTEAETPIASTSSSMNESFESSSMTDEIIPMEKIPQVIYASRTHSQLTQAMRELKNSPYKDIKAGVFASRAQLCIHPDVKKSSNSMYKCRSLTKQNACEFRNNLHAKMNEPDFKKPILDIEELGNLGKDFRCCPYYASKEFHKEAEIIFLPYNYLLDPKIRDVCSIDLKNAIVIFDEAHNVEKACEQNACASINTSDLVNANNELNDVLEMLDAIEPNEGGDVNLEFNLEHVRNLQSRLQDLEGIIIQNAISTNDQLHNGGHLFKLFQRAEITSENYKGYDDLMNNLIQFLCNESSDANGLKKTSEFLRVVFSSSAKELKNKVDQCCKVQLKNNMDYGNPATLNFWCFSPALGTKPLFEKEIRCLIMTSGTLEPLDELEKEMEIPTPIKFTNKHIIDQSQVFVNIVSKGKDGMTFNASFRNRNDVRYLKSLGESIVELCNSIPGGLLIFFASYPVMELCHNYWKNNFNIWTKMQTKRPIYCEAKGESSDKLVETMKKYYNSIDNGDGAIFMAVLRGKVSEGVDFTDMYGRATIIVGIPFAPCREIKVQSKMNYMDIRRSNDRKVMSGSDWYSLDAIKAVNQAIGRVIRHKDDYGAILLFDIRYKEWNKYRHLSTWVQKNPSFGTFDHFQTMNKKLKAFFTHCEQTLPKPKTKHQSIPVQLDFSDDDNVGNDLYNENGESSFHYAANSQDEHSSDRDFITDGTISDQYSDSSSFEVCHKKSKKRQRRSPKKRQKRAPKKRATKNQKQSHTSPKKKFKRRASPSDTESSVDQNTEDERFIDDGNSTDDDDFINDESMDEQYSNASSFEGIDTRSNRKRPVTRSKTAEKRKMQPTKRQSRKSPQPSTSYSRCDRTDHDEKENGSGNDSDESVIQIKRVRNKKNYKRIICISDSESESSNANTNENENPILACFKRSLSTNQYKQLIEAFKEYNNNNGSYESYRDTLFQLFSGSNDASNLIGMMFLLKVEHQSKFDEDIQRKFAE